MAETTDMHIKDTPATGCEMQAISTRVNNALIKSRL